MPRDCARYLDTIPEVKGVYGVKIYTQCLMKNHVHLLVAPAEIAGPRRVMKRLAGRQTGNYNRREGRTGTTCFLGKP